MEMEVQETSPGVQMKFKRKLFDLNDTPFFQRSSILIFATEYRKSTTELFADPRFSNGWLRNSWDIRIFREVPFTKFRRSRIQSLNQAPAGYKIQF